MTPDGPHPPTAGTGSAARVRDALRRSTAGAGRRALLAATLLVGAVAAVLVVAAVPVPSVAVPAAAAQLLVSVLVPLSGILLVHDLTRRPGDDRQVGPVLVAAVLHAAAVAIAVSVVCAVVTALHPQAELGAPGTVVAVVLGGVAVQTTAQLVGTGLGLLLDRSVLAFAATIALPLGLWLLVGALGPLAWLQLWLTPFGATSPLLAGTPSPADVAAWAVVLALWGGVLNAAGAARLARRRSAAH